MITVILILIVEAVLHATQDTVLLTVFASQLIHCAKLSTQMELVLVAILRTLCTKETVCQFLSWLIFYFTMLSAAPRNFKLFKLLKLNQDIDLDFIGFMIIHYSSSLSIKNYFFIL
jgi:hypothetical protein